MNDAKKYVKKRAVKHSLNLFLKVIEYVIFCYKKLELDNKQGLIYYSRKYCKKTTSFKFEDFLKREFVNNYLQHQNFKKLFKHREIKAIDFQYETEKDYVFENIIRSDKIDIFVSNIGLQSYWKEFNREDIYFVFECKILKNNSNNKNYIGDIQKFVERKYKFRFPFEGMIGFIENKSVGILKIIEDINNKLQKSKTIITKKELYKLELVSYFDYLYISQHIKNDTLYNNIEIYHLFFDYSNIIID